MPGRWRVAPDESVDLSAVDPSSTDGAPGDRSTTEDATRGLLDELRGLQEKLWAEKRSALLVVLQGMDTSGKDGTIKKICGAMDPHGVRIRFFRAPTPEELAHDFLWRIHNVVPARGEIGVFNRSHYEDVLVPRVLGLVPKDVWGARYDLITAFEEQLAHGGATIVKLFLHISKDEQRLRLQKRVDDPSKRWKFNPADLEQRQRWDDYIDAYQDAIGRTSTPAAPWYIVPADRKWIRNYVVSRILVDALKKIDPRFPEPPDVTDVTID